MGFTSVKCAQQGGDSMTNAYHPGKIILL